MSADSPSPTAGGLPAPLAAKIAAEGLTFDDVLVQPGFSAIMPSEVDVSSRLTERIPLGAPILSSPMDTVTEHRMAIGLAQVGGLGVIHKNLPIDEQAAEVEKVKRSANGIISDPVTLPPEAMVAEARVAMIQSNVSGVPITDASGKLVGILTRRDLRFLDRNDLPIGEVMTRDPAGDGYGECDASGS